MHLASSIIQVSPESFAAILIIVNCFPQLLIKVLFVEPFKDVFVGVAVQI